MKVLLLNPPGKEIYIRDYFCSKVSKTNYIYTPVDLLIVGARLSHVAELAAIDAIAEKLSEVEVLKKVMEFNPDVIVSLTASVSWYSDLCFFQKLRKSYNGKLIVSGDVLMDAPAMILKQVSYFDAILLDFTSDEIVEFCNGSQGPFQTIYTRPRGFETGVCTAGTRAGSASDNARCAGDKAGRKSDIRRSLALHVASTNKSYEIPIPPHELFPHSKYMYPFVKKSPFATVLTDFGCVFKCTFCIQSQLEFKARSVENVMNELRYLKEKGFKEIYFADQTFAFNPQRAKKLFEAMIEENLNFGWVAFYRVDLVKDELLKLMKKAGCHTLMFGIESANEALLKDYKKNIQLKTVWYALESCKSLDIRTVGTFILGFPEETRQDILQTIQFSLELPLDFVSYNLAVPRSKTLFREKALRLHRIVSDLLDANPLGIMSDLHPALSPTHRALSLALPARIPAVQAPANPLLADPSSFFQMDQSGKFSTMGNSHLTKKELFQLRNSALRRFYLRPRYLLKRLMSIGGLQDFWIQLQNGFVLLREAFSHTKQFPEYLQHDQDRSAENSENYSENNNEKQVQKRAA